MMKKISGWVIKPIHLIIVVVVMCMVLLATSQIVFRYILKISVPWTEEVARVFFVWMIFIGTVLVEEDGSQVRTMLVVDKLPPKLQIVWESVITATSVLFQLILFFGSIKSLDSAANISLGSVTWIRYWVFFVPVLIASPICIWYMITNLIAKKRKLFPKEDQV